MVSALHKKEGFGGRPLLAALMADPQSERGYGMFEAYAKSKLAQAGSEKGLMKGWGRAAGRLLEA